MSLDDIVKFERKKVKKLVPFYRWRERRELVKTFDLLLDHCKDNEIRRSTADVIGRVAYRTKDPTITLEACQALYPYVNRIDLGTYVNHTRYSEYVISLMDSTVGLCDDVKAISSLSYILELSQKIICSDTDLRKLARLTSRRNHEPLIAFSNLLKKYSDKINNLIIRDVVLGNYENNVSSQQLMKMINFLDEHIENDKGIVTNFPELLKSYLGTVFYNLEDDLLGNSLSKNEIRLVNEAYQIVMWTAKDWSEEDKEIVHQAFFDKLNTNVSTGKDLSDRKRILREYCCNVTRMVEKNPNLFRFSQLQFAQPQHTTQYKNVEVSEA